MSTEELIQIDGWDWIGCCVCSARLGYFKQDHLPEPAVCSPECAQAFEEMERKWNKV